MPSKLEQIVATAVTLFLVLTNNGLGGNLGALETREPRAAESPRQELVKAGSKECPPGVPPNIKPQAR